MVEVEYDDVGLSTIDARMSPKEFTDERPVLFAISPDPGDLLSYVGLAVPDVVLTPVLRMAGTTSSLPCALRLVVERERLNRLESAAVVAPLDRGLCRRHCERDRHG